jgi:hypothetical protein
MPLDYLLITPARNETTFIEKTPQSVLAQTILPKRWIIVSDGSTDGTDEIVRKYQPGREWLELIRLPERKERNFAAMVNAVNTGYDRVKALAFDVVGNLDADVFFGEDCMEYLLGKFERDPKLGVAGAHYIEGDFHSYGDSYINVHHVNGQIQLFRRACFEEIGGYVPIEGGGIDCWVAVTTARMKGGTTYSFSDRTFNHGRKMGTAGSSELRARFHYGTKDYFLGEHPVWELFRGAFQMAQKPYVVGSLGLMAGYAFCWLTWHDCPISPALMAFPPAAPSAKKGTVEISVRGRKVAVPALQVQNRTVIVTGGWLKIASVYDEEVIDEDVIENPESFLRDLARAKCGADIFTFPQRFSETQPKYSYPFEWDNTAVVPITTYEEWFNRRIGADVKRNIKKAAKAGVVTRLSPLDDAFVRGIVGIYGESPIRQGRPFWHYGKDFETVKAETSHCLEKSEFIGAYCGDEMIGFAKLLRTGMTNDLVLIVSKQSHFDKKATNALFAKAVEVCVEKGMRYLTYPKFVYGNRANSSLTEYKRRHGFERIDFPRYYVPLTLTGRLAVKLRLYRSLAEMLPETALSFLVDMRARFYKMKST